MKTMPILIAARHQGIAQMKEYENKSLEESRMEGYAANPKGCTDVTRGFGATSNTNSLCCSATPSTQSSGGLFGNTSAFGSPRPTFEGFNATTPDAGLFGQCTNTGVGLFGSSGVCTTTAAPSQTTVKFNPPTGTDTMMKGGVSTCIRTRHQCITGMKEYENKSLEELRVEEFAANCKGSSGSAIGKGFGTPIQKLGLSGIPASNLFTFGSPMSGTTRAEPLLQLANELITTGAPSRMTVKFNPPTGTDTMMKEGVSTCIRTRHQCITCMREYENKSLEELRIEYYAAKRKGVNGWDFAMGLKTPLIKSSLFGGPPAVSTSAFSFGGTEPKPLVTTTDATSKDLFGATSNTNSFFSSAASSTLSTGSLLGTTPRTELHGQSTSTGAGLSGTASNINSSATFPILSSGGLCGTTSAFRVAQTTTPEKGLFGQSTNTKAALFNTTSNTNNSFGIATLPTQSFGGLFCTTSAVSTPHPAFVGVHATTPKTGLFGQSTNTGASLFGVASNTSNSSSTPSTPSFGGSFGTTSAFGDAYATTPGTGLFGKSTNTGAALFGTTFNANNSFCNATPPTTTSGSLFGTTPTFGIPHPTFGGTHATIRKTGLFGRSTNAGSGLSCLGGFTTAFPSEATVKFNPPTGTDTMTKTVLTMIRHQCIVCMEEYKNKSLEELRLEDYAANCYYGSAVSAAGMGFKTLKRTPINFEISEAVPMSEFPIVGMTDSKPLSGTTGATNLDLKHSAFTIQLQSHKGEVFQMNLDFAKMSLSIKMLPDKPGHQDEENTR